MGSGHMAFQGSRLGVRDPKTCESPSHEEAIVAPAPSSDISRPGWP